MPDPIPRPAGPCALETQSDCGSARFLFYVDAADHIVYYKWVTHTGGSYEYQGVITEENQPVKVNSKRINGIVYSGNQIRIYYVKTFESGRTYIREACGVVAGSNHNVRWFQGLLNNDDFAGSVETTEDTFITALVDQREGYPWVMFSALDMHGHVGTRVGHIRPSSTGVRANNDFPETWDSAIVALHGGHN